MLLKDLIEIPAHYGSQDFVLKLTEGVTDEQARETLAQYVVTPKLASCFDQALGILRGALGLSVGPDGAVHDGPHQPGRAVYLHGSFGSGKSHFMAVLHRLLHGDTQALSRPELAEVVAEHRPWLGTKRFLLVPYHMLGASSLEERVFDGYCRAIQREHPDADVPALFDTDAVIRDAESLRKRVGDEKFLGLLEDDSGDEGWGDLAGSWTLDSYHAATRAPHGSTERQRVATAIVERIFPNLAGRTGTMPFDQGLELMARHARGLGYDAIVLFLDELILWLAGHASTPGFIEREVDKLVNLVEAQRLDRPIPIVGFIARQRDLRELIQRQAPGAQQLDIDDKLAHHEGRFTTIELKTTDLPEIASKRLLKPRDAAARQRIDAAFHELVGGRDELRRTLLGDTYTLDDFRKVYPFSPVLVDTLVQAASMLQRDRTALRAMLQLLVERRATLALGELIPVGDLYDVISRGNDAVTGSFKEAFDRARQLYEQRLVPLLEAEHGLSRDEAAALDWSDEKRRKWRADDRILKTLLLASLVSNVPALADLSAQRIALLNHGSITARIPGQEVQLVLRRLREWAVKVPEIRITGDAQNPRIALEVHGVDIQGIVERARGYDNHGNRVLLVKQTLHDELGLQEGRLDTNFELVWRGTKRAAQVLFANVADLPQASLENDGSDWKVIIDYPVDERADAADRDEAKLAGFRGAGRTARTLVWCPAFLNQEGRDDLGRLVIVERVLKSDQTFEQASEHLSSADRLQARALLEGQREVLRQRIQGYLRAAYGLSSEATFTRALVEPPAVERTFISLDPAFAPRPPASGNVRQGLESLLAHALEHQFPGAPRWTRTFTSGQLKKCLGFARRAAASRPPRVTLDTADLKLMRELADPLELGETSSAFVLHDKWRNRLESQCRREGPPSMTVGDLRRWMDDPEPRGLPRDVQDLITIVFAEQTERAFFRHGAPLEDAELGGLKSDDELRTIPLPDEPTWKRACERAAAIFGLAPELFLTGANLASVARRVREQVVAARPAAVELHRRLLERTPEELRERSARLKDARAALELFEALDVEEGKALVERLASAAIAEPVTPQSLAASFKQAQSANRALEQTNWTLLQGLAGLEGDPRKADSAKALIRELNEALSAHQYVTPLEPALQRVVRKATELLVEPKRPEPGSAVVASGRAEVQSAAELDALVRNLRRQLDVEGTRVELDWKALRRSDA